jgi:hypothetical protein
VRTPKNDTISAILELLDDLARVGEISNECLRAYPIPDYYWATIYRSGLVFSNANALIASPFLLSYLPFSSKWDLSEKLGLPWNSSYSWSQFPTAITLPDIEDSIGKLDYHYAYKPITKPIFEDTINRPVFLYQYIANNADFDEWTFEKIIQDWRVYSEPKKYVHGTLPIDEISNGLNSLQKGVWNHPIYLISLQFLLLSDVQTGSTYQQKISLVLLDGFTENGTLNVYLDNDYICDFRDLLTPILDHFRWIWVNKSDDVMHIFKLLYKCEMMEKERDGRASLTNEFRRVLLENNSPHYQFYRQSHPPRDWIRELVKQRGFKST